MTIAASLTSCLVRDPDGIVRELGSDELRFIDRQRSIPGSLVWLDLTDPDAAAMKLLADEFVIHPLALEDVDRRNQRPKIDSYPDQQMVVAYEAVHGSVPEAPARLAELHYFAGSGWLVSVHWGEAPSVSKVRAQFVRGGAGVGDDVGRLLHALLDAAVDSYFPVLDATSERIDELEDRILAGREDGTLRKLLETKRELLELRRVIAPMRDVANGLLRRDLAIVDDDAVPYYQDLFDHLIRLLDQADLFRDQMATVLEARLSTQSNALNVIMKRLTAITVILMVPTLIAGIYGMNFDYMPELGWPFGYPLALVIMALTMAGAIIFFRRRNWF